MLLGAAVSLFLYLYQFPQKIDLAYPAMEYRAGKPESAEAITIKVKGMLTKPLFRKQTFRGKIIIDKYEFTKTYNLIDLDFSQWNNDFYDDNLYYYHVDVNGSLVSRPLGSLVISDQFAQLNIWVMEKIGETSWTGKDLHISAPARNYEEAVKINEDLFGY
ncbi:hypothetical protein [Paenibacillus spongiae]|uniref:DUF4367 domain-containing protein n=1 Tax=Paenibacillus spongiae TaxID=2909671 RepID=A0ABY5S6W9_9BACL|nr:hypothetical protein [Paenibacillus spongiae]UVI29656.1 hypothetical protein L1F29_30300 [Paenibacillus spongiae]